MGGDLVGYTGSVWLRGGLEFNVLAPNYRVISIENVAHSLSQICRYGGQSERFLSVAEHSVYVSQHCSHPLWGLLHDAAEGLGLSDLPRGVKLAVGRAYTDIEDGVLRAVAERFDLPWPMPEDVKLADNRVLATEIPVLMGPRTWPELPDPIDGLEIQCLDPESARSLFMERYAELTGQLVMSGRE